jgi:trans-aconitate 2-methyltransferase
LRGAEHILDVGCGDGKVTAELAQAVPQGSVVGIDNAPEMIRFAADKFSGPLSANLQFQVMDARQMRFSQPFDLVVSNAALHWVDDHSAFLQGAAAGLRNGGRLVVSCGGQGNAQKVFIALRGTIRLPRWRGWFRQLATPYFFYRTAEYKHWLPRCGFAPATIQLTAMDACHENPTAFAAWFRTTWMPYTQRVPEAAREEFVAEVVARYLRKNPVDAQGHVRVGMVRLEIDAVKAKEG